MAGDDEIDWSGFDEPDQLPAPDPAEALAHQVALDEIKSNAAKVQYDPSKFAVTGPNTYDCKDALKALGCRWNGSNWIARDAQMLLQAAGILKTNSHRAKPVKRCGRCGRAPCTCKGLNVTQSIAPPLLKSHRRCLDQRRVTVEPRIKDPGQLSTEELAGELERRGYTVVKMGQAQTLAELLAEQDDEDPFEKILEVLNR